MIQTPMELQKIHFSQKETVDRVRSEYGHTLSSHAFASLYLWQHAMKLSLLCNEDFFAVQCGDREENAWFFPCGKEEEKYRFISEKISDQAFSLCYLRECDMKWLEERFPGRWLFRRAKSSDEYICNISEYLSLEGSKFAEIRRKIRKIDRTYRITTAAISDETVCDALKVAEQWYGEEHHIGENGLTDDMIAELALKERKKLEISGIILYVDHVPASLFAGFPLSLDTVDVLIGKCTPNAPKGIAYYALREYLRSLGGRYVYCNHEEDLGIEGIRQMKSSLCPITKTKIWEAVLR